MRPWMRLCGCVSWSVCALASAEEPVAFAHPDTDVSLVDEYRWVEAVSRRRQRIETTPQPVAVLLPDDMVLYPALTVADRLRTIGGIDVYQSRHGQFDVGMRGFNGSLNPRLLVTVGPLEFRQEEFGAVLWRGVFFASDVERIEVLKGPGSVTYGANAFGGVVAVRERKVGDDTDVRVVASAGNPLSMDFDATAMGPLGDASGPLRGFQPYYKLSVGATHLNDLPAISSGLPETGNPRGANTGDTDLASTRIAGMAGLRIADTRVELGVRHLNLSTWEMVDNLDSGSNNDPHRYLDVIGRVAGSWGEVTHTWRNARNRYENQKVSYDPSQDFRYTQGATDNVEHVSRAQFPVVFGDHTLTVGGEFRHWQSRSNLWTTSGRFSDDATWATVTTSQLGAFIEEQWSPSPFITLNAGVRGDDHSRTGFNTSPRLAINYNPSPNTAYLAALSYGYRNPTPIESYLSEFYYTSNSALKAEHVASLELSWSHRIADQHLIGVNVFANQAQDLIRIMPLDAGVMEDNYNRWLNAYASGNASAPLGPILQFTNINAPLITYGGEVQMRSQISREWLLWGNATAQISRYTKPIRFASEGFISIDPATGLPARLFAFDRTFPLDVDAPPKLQLNVGAIWRSDGWFASSSGRAVGSRTTFALSDSYLLRDGIVAVADVPGYAALDLAAGYRWGDHRWLRVVCMDVLDSQHVEGTPSNATLLRRESEDQNISTLGRMIALQGAWRF